MRLERRLALKTLLGAPLVLSGCTSARDNARTISVLLDFSGTYFRQVERCFDAVKAVVARLNPLDSITVSRIDSCSFSNEAVLLRMRLPDTPSAATRAKRAAIIELERRKNLARSSSYTDIIGALYQSSAELRESQTSNRYLIIFSDLEQDLAPNCEAGRDEMPQMEGITVIASNVIILNDRRPQAYFERIEAWERRFLDAGAKEWRVIRDPSQVQDLFSPF